ncbi:MAG: glycosyltransferase family 2 protein [Gammaproteobacteria bacterium]
MEKLSVCITTFNNERTLGACLESVKWADEIVVLDSFSTDKTLDIAHAYHCRVSQHRFLGYGKQKQMALDAAHNQWALLLDADEALSPTLQEQIKELMQQGPKADGYEIPRLEQMFWRMNDPRTRLNYFLRLFNRSKCRMSDMPVHAAPKVDGVVARLLGHFYHYGEIDIHTKVEKLNGYSTGVVADKLAKGKAANPWILVFYPPLYFLRTYVFKRNFLNGWPGFITSVAGAFYVFLKYAKLYEHYQRERYGDSLMPEGAPSSRVERPVV